MFSHWTVATECPKIYRKSVLHLPEHRFALYLSRCSTDLRQILGHSVATVQCENIQVIDSSCSRYWKWSQESTFITYRYTMRSGQWLVWLYDHRISPFRGITYDLTNKELQILNYMVAWIEMWRSEIHLFVTQTGNLISSRHCSHRHSNSRTKMSSAPYCFLTIAKRRT